MVRVMEDEDPVRCEREREGRKAEIARLLQEVSLKERNDRLREHENAEEERALE